MFVSELVAVQIAQLREAITTIADGVHGTRKPMKVSLSALQSSICSADIESLTGSTE